MGRVIWLLVALATIVGCGGIEPCGGTSWGTSNFAYEGWYDGGFEHASDPSQDTTFDLVVSDLGYVSGTATRGGETVNIEEVSNVYDWLDSCGEDATLMVLRFTPSGGQAVLLYASRELGQTQPWEFRVRTETSGGVIGTLTLARRVAR